MKEGQNNAVNDERTRTCQECNNLIVYYGVTNVAMQAFFMGALLTARYMRLTGSFVRTIAKEMDTRRAGLYLM